MSAIADNLQAVQARIAKAAAAAGRSPESVRLLAVSKTWPLASVIDAADAGQRAFGENYVQEALGKIAALGDLRAQIEWHLIGPLQSNKTRPVAEAVDWVHSVDRLKIAQRCPGDPDCVDQGDNVLYVGYGAENITPEVETFTDLDGNRPASLRRP